MARTEYNFDISFCEDHTGSLILKLPRGKARPGMVAIISDGRSFTLRNVFRMGEDLYPCYIAMCNERRCLPVTELREILWRRANGQ